MMHRPTCVIVTGRTDLRAVRPGEHLGACQLCDPLGSAPGGEPDRQ
jgi:hypothetical protein